MYNILFFIHFYQLRCTVVGEFPSQHFALLLQFFSPKVLSSPVVVIKLLHFDRSVLWLVTLGVETLNHTVCKIMYIYLKVCNNFVLLSTVTQITK